MKLSRERFLANLAAARLHTQREQLTGHLQFVRNRFESWRPAIIVGGGLLGGYLLGQRRVTRLASGVASLASVGIALMRTSLVPLAISVFRGTRERSTQDRKQDPRKNH